MTTIELYKTRDGKRPVNEYLLSLEPKLLAKTMRNIDLLEKYGSTLRNQNSKALGNGILEIRTKQGSNITRILYFSL